MVLTRVFSLEGVHCGPNKGVQFRGVHCGPNKLYEEVVFCILYIVLYIVLTVCLAFILHVIVFPPVYLEQGAAPCSFLAANF